MNIKGTNRSERLFGTAENDVVHGMNGNDHLSDRIGEISDDRYYGGGGRDHFISHGGNDFMFGGSGDDRFDFSQTDANIVISGGDGDDTIFVSASIFADGEIEKFNSDYHQVLMLAGGGTLDVSGIEHLLCYA